MPMFKVDIEAQRLIHNDLSNCAHQFKQQVQQKEKNDDEEGIFFPTIAALTFLAFSLEAKINFIGFTLLKDEWQERAPLKNKIETIYKFLGQPTDWGKEPLQTCMELKNFRDTIAHGKPESITETSIEKSEPEVREVLRAQWERQVTSGFVEAASKAVDRLWKDLLEKSGIPIQDTITQGYISSELLEK